jgi:hypothetical protein
MLFCAKMGFPFPLTRDKETRYDIKHQTRLFQA